MKILFILFVILIGCSKKGIVINDLHMAKPLIEDQSRYESKGEKYAISSQGEYTSIAAKKMFDLGGNVIDAATAMTFVISVERPHSTGIGGGGFLLASGPLFKKPIAIDFREMAPINSNEFMYLDKNLKVIDRLSIDGIKAVAVPGLVAGILELHEKYGKLPLSLVMAPSIELCKKGFPIYEALHEAIVERESVLKQTPDGRKLFFDISGKPLKINDQLRQPDLAITLQKIAKYKKSAFYEGDVAKRIIETSNEHGGILTLEDLTNYRVMYRTPISGEFRGHHILTMPPPSSGGIHIVQILNMLEADELKSPQSAKDIHLISQAMQQAFADRAKYLGDADFVKVPVKNLLDKNYALSLRARFSTGARDPRDIHPGNFSSKEKDHTTHFSLMDRDENVVVSTQTINGHFGSGIIAKGTGIILNNEMDDFAAKAGASNLFGAIGGNNNLIAPKKRPLSSMSPTIVFKNNHPILALGTPSGTRILTCVTNVILNHLVYNFDLYKSVALTRFHHQWHPNEIRFDETGLPKNTINSLARMGYQLLKKDLGCEIEAISKTENGFVSVADPRGVGMAISE